MLYRRGDVVLVLYPNSDLRTFKRRPALVVLADGLNTGLSQTVVAMVTSNMSRAGGCSRVTISKASPSGQQTQRKTPGHGRALDYTVADTSLVTDAGE